MKRVLWLLTALLMLAGCAFTPEQPTEPLAGPAKPSQGIPPQSQYPMGPPMGQMTQQQYNQLQQMAMNMQRMFGQK